MKKWKIHSRKRKKLSYLYIARKIASPIKSIPTEAVSIVGHATPAFGSDGVGDSVAFAIGDVVARGVPVEVPVGVLVA
ncbi:hypothetical protein KBA63_04400, partial [Candidatus Woesebacteria bacterium]|nr:hypothetical protein [Candidatus Woesebacteria bacterium]